MPEAHANVGGENVRNMVWAHNCESIFKISLSSGNGFDYFQCKNVKHLVHQGTAFYEEGTQGFLNDEDGIQGPHRLVINVSNIKWSYCAQSSNNFCCRR